MGPLVYLSYEIRINVHSLNAGSGLVKGIPFEPTSFSAAPMTEYKGFRGLVGTPTAITQPGYNCLSFRQQLPHSSVPGDGITYGNIVSIGGSDDVCWVGSILYRCE